MRQDKLGTFSVPEPSRDESRFFGIDIGLETQHKAGKEHNVIEAHGTTPWPNSGL